MNIEKKILQDYKAIYPQDTFEQISFKTGIQVTRVFRIFKGSSMKLKEFLSFKSILQKDSLQDALFRKCQEELYEEDIKELKNHMQFLLQRKHFLGELQ
jgi:hypothetical protein